MNGEFTARRRSAFGALLVGGICLVCAVGESAQCAARPVDPAPANKIANSCGPLALRTVMELLGRSVELEQCARLANTDETSTTSLAALSRAANALGMKAVGMHVRPEELALLNRPTILHVSLPNVADHFVVFASVREGRYEIIDPARGDGKSLYLPAQLRLMWTGDCLVFTDAPRRAAILCGLYRLRQIIATIMGSLAGVLLIAGTCKLLRSGWLSDSLSSRTALRFSHRSLVLIGLVSTLVSVGCVYGHAYFHPAKPGEVVLGASLLQLGTLEWGQSFVTSVWLDNGGPRPLKPGTVTIKTSCACIRAAIPGGEVAPLQKRSLRIRVGPLTQMGPFRYSVLVQPQAGAAESAVLTLEGHVDGPGGVAYPPRLYFGRVTNIAEARKTIRYVLLRPDTRILDVTSNCAFAKCTFRHLDTPAYRVDISLQDLSAPGPFEGTIVIRTTDPRAGEIIIPFSGILEAPGESVRDGPARNALEAGGCIESGRRA